MAPQLLSPVLCFASHWPVERPPPCMLQLPRMQYDQQPAGATFKGVEVALFVQATQPSLKLPGAYSCILQLDVDVK